MINWLTANIHLVTILVCCIVPIALMLWFWWRMRQSKATFALSVLSSILSCVFLFSASATGSLPAALVNFAISAAYTKTEWAWLDPSYLTITNWWATLGAFLVTLASIIAIYRFGVSAIKNWDGPVTISVNELAKDELDQNLAALALARAKLLLSWRDDPLASKFAIDWRQKLTEAPPRPSWNDLSRSLFMATFREAIVPEIGWRDKGRGWVGEMYVGASSNTAPLVLLVFDAIPTDAEVVERLQHWVNPPADLKWYVLYHSPSFGSGQTFTVGGFSIEFWSSKSLQLANLGLANYARDLIRQFDNVTVGGTDVTLASSYVAARVSRPSDQSSVALSSVISSWLKEPGRRHLAITGEYGQGKSTAMLELCAGWAKRWLTDPTTSDRIPLLIELRGKNPAETDPVSFLSSWAGRYGLQADQLFNLVRAGNALLIFEGFDELRNAGRAFDRHEHFNALWKFAFPDTKIIFTGRPNFFLGEQEKNTSLRTDGLRGAGDNAFTELWQIEKLQIEEISEVCRAFDPKMAQSIVQAAKDHSGFFDIVSRPSMIPVVATIWPTIEKLQDDGHDLTGALLIEYYLSAIYRRKEQELEEDVVNFWSPPGSSYIVLPRAFREIMTLCVTSRMSMLGLQNTIPRDKLRELVSERFDAVLTLLKSSRMSADIVSATITFEERYKDETKADRIERAVSELATAGLLVADPAGGPSNLRFAHKQYYEYLLAKTIWTMRARNSSAVSRVLLGTSPQSSILSSYLMEPGASDYMNEILSGDYSIFSAWYVRPVLLLSHFSEIVMRRFYISVTNIRKPPEYRLSMHDLNADDLDVELYAMTRRAKGRTNSAIQYASILAASSAGFAGFVSGAISSTTVVPRAFWAFLIINVLFLTPALIAAGRRLPIFKALVWTAWVRYGPASTIWEPALAAVHGNFRPSKPANIALLAEIEPIA